MRKYNRNFNNVEDVTVLVFYQGVLFHIPLIGFFCKKTSSVTKKKKDKQCLNRSSNFRCILDSL